MHFSSFFARLLVAAVLTACGAAAPQAQPTQSSLAVPSVTEPETAQAEIATGAVPPAQPSSELLPVEPHNAVWGQAKAPVTLIAFLDLQCPFSARSQATLASLQGSFGKEKLRIVFKHLPMAFHKQARVAAVAAQSVLHHAGDEAFHGFLKDVFALDGKGMELETLAQLATRHGMTAETLRQDIAGARFNGEVQRDEELAKRLNLNGVPTFYVNGSVLNGAKALAEFEAVVRAELTATVVLAAAGEPGENLYAKRVAYNFAHAPAVAAKDTKDANEDTAYQVEIGTSPTLGPKDAPITLVEFGDFECPFCKRVQATLAELETRYPGKIRRVFKHNPLAFHTRALPAALFAIEARRQGGDQAFWKAHAELFAAADLSEASLLALGRKLGLKQAPLLAALKRNEAADIDRDQELAAELRAPGTPNFFINGQQLRGAVPIDKFAAVIDARLAEAAQLIASQHVAPANVYATLMKSAAPRPGLLERKNIPAPNGSVPFRGSVGAPVEVQMFSDFQCPFCQRVEPTLEKILQRFKGQVRVVWRHLPLPFHRDAALAAEAAEEARAQRGNAGFWLMHAKLFENQQSLDRAALEQYAAEIGLDATKFRAALDDRRHRARVDADAALAAAAEISGTPTFVINGYLVAGAQNEEAFARVIRRALNERRHGKHP